jgi:hypothetical protein
MRSIQLEAKVSVAGDQSDQNYYQDMRETTNFWNNSELSEIFHSNQVFLENSGLILTKYVFSVVYSSRKIETHFIKFFIDHVNGKFILNVYFLRISK